MRLFKDQMHREIGVPTFPQRIVSTVPSQTEFLFDLGLNNEVVGITKFCVHPESARQTARRIGGTKTLDLDEIRSLKPDLILANREENNQDQIETLASEFPVWISDITTLQGAFDMMSEVGDMVGKAAQAAHMQQVAENKWDELNNCIGRVDTAYCIWNNPLMFAGKDTFIHAVLEWVGFNNVMVNEPGRYPELDFARLNELNPEVVFLSSEPFPFQSKHQTIFAQKSSNNLRQFPLVDGEMFSWYGSRLILAADYIKQLVDELNLKTS